jgi:hypothetical protein
LSTPSCRERALLYSIAARCANIYCANIGSAPDHRGG